MRKYFFFFLKKKALWAFMCLIGFKYLWGEWSNAETPPMGYGDGNVKATIFFLFLLIGTWVNFNLFNSKSSYF